jgi:hypothetical protein
MNRNNDNAGGVGPGKIGVPRGTKAGIADGGGKQHQGQFKAANPNNGKSAGPSTMGAPGIKGPVGSKSDPKPPQGTAAGNSAYQKANPNNSQSAVPGNTDNAGVVAHPQSHAAFHKLGNNGTGSGR